MPDKERTRWEQYQELQRGAADAYDRSVEAAAELRERYSAEAFAASGSDDVVAKSYTAWLNYQQGLANVAYDYWRAIADYRRNATTLVYDEEEATTTSMYESYRDNIDQVVSDIGARSGGGTSIKVGSSRKSGQGTSAPRRRTRSRSSPD